MSAILSFEVEGRGYGAVLAWDPALPDQDVQSLLTRMKQLARKPLRAFSSEWKCLPQTQAPIKAVRAPRNPPADMIRLPGGEFEFRSRASWWRVATRLVSTCSIRGKISAPSPSADGFELKPFWIHRYPVTNARFKEFLDATGLPAADEHNFLKDWNHGTFPAGWDNRPVTWVTSKMRAPTPAGRANACRMNGNGNMPPKGPTAASTPGAMNPTPQPCRPPDQSRSPRPPTEWTLSRAGPAPLA